MKGFLYIYFIEIRSSCVSLYRFEAQALALPITRLRRPDNYDLTHLDILFFVLPLAFQGVCSESISLQYPTVTDDYIKAETEIGAGLDQG